MPPHETEYQYHAEFKPNDPPETVNEVLAPWQSISGVADKEVSAEEGVFTIIEVLTHVVVLHNPWALR